LALLLWVGQMVDGHVHVAPHGGTISHAGPYHLEVVVDEKGVDLWVLDRHMKPVAAAGHSVRLTAMPRGGPAQRLVLSPSGDRWQAAADLASFPALEFKVQVRWGRKTAHASFRWTLLDRRDRIQDGDPLQGLKL
jgi:hypothetical protein